MRGVVKRFSDFQGWGFISGANRLDYFVHHSMIEASGEDDDGYKTLRPGEEVFFEPVKTVKGWQAWAVRRVEKTRSVPVQKNLRLNPFTPQHPVTDPKKFAGRVDVLVNTIDCLFNNKNVLVTGARGVGKSSVAYQLIKLTRGDRTLIDRIGLDTGGFEFNHITGDHRCLPGNTLSSVAQGLLGSLRSRLASGHTEETVTQTLDLKFFKRVVEVRELEARFDELALEFALAAEEIVSNVELDNTGLAFLIDEIDILDDSVQLAPFLKAVSEKLRLDGYESVSFVLAGVSGTTADLVAQHPSASRLFELFTLEPMTHDELEAIVDSAVAGTGVHFTAAAVREMIALADYFPAPVQLLGYHAFRIDDDGTVDEEDVKLARDFIVQNIKKQEFETRLERLGGGLGGQIVRALSRNPTGLSIERLERLLGVSRTRIYGTAGNLLEDGYLKQTSKGYNLAEPLFGIYIRWLAVDS